MTRSIIITLVVALLLGSCVTSPVSVDRKQAHRPATFPNSPNSTYTLSVSDRGVNIGVGIDVLGISQAIAKSVSVNQNRDAFVKNLVNTAFYNARRKYNVMVFNLNEHHTDRFKSVKLYGSADYHGTIFGIWVFESGEFWNHGDGGYENWGFRGWFDRHGHHGKHVVFHKP